MQEYLLGASPPPSLASTFSQAASTLTFTDQLYKWVEDKWLPYPPHGLQQLLLEEVHLQHQHVGGEKLYHLMATKYFWPSM